MTMEMEDGTEDRRKQSVLERHFASVMSLIILAAVLGVAGNLYSQGIKQVELLGLMNNLELRVVHLKETMNEAGDDRYKGKDALADKKQLDLRFNAEKTYLKIKLESIDTKFNHCHIRLSRLETIVNKAIPFIE